MSIGYLLAVLSGSNRNLTYFILATLYNIRTESHYNYLSCCSEGGALKESATHHNLLPVAVPGACLCPSSSGQEVGLSIFDSARVFLGLNVPAYASRLAHRYLRLSGKQFGCEWRGNGRNASQPSNQYEAPTKALAMVPLNNHLRSNFYKNKYCWYAVTAIYSS